MAFYKRSIFLINPSFQLRFSFVVCSIIILSSLIYPVIIYDFFTALSSEMSQLQENINKIQKELIFYLIIIQLVMTVLVLVIFIFLTHKIAGPLYKLKNHLFKIRTGSPITPLTFREGDYFHDVAEEVSLFLETVKSNQETDFENIDDIATYLKNLSSVVPDDKRPVLDEIHRRLIQVQKRYQEDV